MEAHSNDISSAIDNKSKKSRKPYTITKPRESWTDDEHHMFVEALKMYERDWKKIEGHVKTKTVIQIRSHAQKYFIKMQKTGKVEMIPPPRPKRRSKKPYPKSHAERKRKMNDDAPFMNSISNEYMHQPYPYGIASGVNAPTPPQTSSHDVGHALHWAVWERKQLAKLRQGQLTQAQYYLQQAISAHTSEETANDTKQTAKPNFQRIYSFLGSLFDPSTTGHVLQLRTMDDMDRQVVQLLMQNLAANLGKHHSVTNDCTNNVTSGTNAELTNTPRPSNILSPMSDGTATTPGAQRAHSGMVGAQRAPTIEVSHGPGAPM